MWTYQFRALGCLLGALSGMAVFLAVLVLGAIVILAQLAR